MTSWWQASAQPVSLYVDCECGIIGDEVAGDVLETPQQACCLHVDDQKCLWNATYEIEDLLPAEFHGSLQPSTDRVRIASVATHTAIRSPWMLPLSFHLPYGHLLDVTTDALGNLPFKPCVDPTYLELHVDGCGVDGAPFAMCVLWQDQDPAWHFGGFRLAMVCSSPLDVESLGACCADSNASELSAFCWAMLYILQHCCDAKICYDSEFAANTAKPLWRSASKSVLATTATALYTLVDTAANITTVHEYGHCGMPFNELCDSLCRYLRKTGCGHSPVERTPIRHWATTHQLAAQCAFILALTPEQRAQYPFIFRYR